MAERVNTGWFAPEGAYRGEPVTTKGVTSDSALDRFCREINALPSPTFDAALAKNIADIHATHKRLGLPEPVLP